VNLGVVVRGSFNVARTEARKTRKTERKKVDGKETKKNRTEITPPRMGVSAAASGAAGGPPEALPNEVAAAAAAGGGSGVAAAVEVEVQEDEGRGLQVVMPPRKRTGGLWLNVSRAA